MNQASKTNCNSLIPQPSTSVTTTSDEGSIVSRMLGVALETARHQAAQEVRKTFTVGDFELREPDYRQVLRWANSLGWKPEEVLGELSNLSAKQRDGSSTAKLHIENGLIKQLVWDGDRLPIREFEWEFGLELELLAIVGRMPDWNSANKLPSLQTLWINFLELIKLDLSPVPALTTLWCYKNQLTTLDLSPVPRLKKLVCSRNPLTELDLSPVTELTELSCANNKLTELELSPVKGLRRLGCAFNELSQLDLSPVPDLEGLCCSFNQLVELDLSPVPKLTELICDENRLYELDLRPLANPNIEIKCDPLVLITR